MLTPLTQATGLRYGLEIEFASPVELTTVHYALREALGVTPLATQVKLREHSGAHSHWAMDYESDTYHWKEGLRFGMEVKSRINAPADEIRRVADALRALGCKPTRKCGAHVHISHPDKPVRARMPPVEIWPERLAEVAPKNDHGDHRRAKGIYQFDDRHLEIRLFNSRLDADYLIANIALCLTHAAHDGQNDWLSVPIAAMPRAIPVPAVAPVVPLGEPSAVPF